MLNLSTKDYRDFIFRLLKSPLDLGKASFSRVAAMMQDPKYRLTVSAESEICVLVGQWADVCDVRYYNGMYYAYDGKLYSEVAEDMLYWGFKAVLRSCGIELTLPKLNYMYKHEFLMEIRTLNVLEPRLDVIAFRNGVLDLSTFILHPFSPEFHVMSMRPYDFDPRARCPKWIKFLKEVLPEKGKRDVLQMFMGLGVMERGVVYGHSSLNKVNLALLLVGNGANGKSVILETAKGLFGPSKIQGLDYDTLTADGDEGMRNRGALVDATFNWCDDESSSRFGNKKTAGMFKRMVSGEPVPMRRLKHDPQMVTYVPYLVFNLNELPYPDDASLGFLRRLQIIYFSRSIPEKDQNKHLAEELIAEYPGIFNWLVRGARELRRRDFRFPETVTNKREKYLVMMAKNPVRAWMECYGVKTEAQVKSEAPIWVSAGEMHRLVLKFCEDNDADQPSTNSIGRQLKEARFVKQRKPDGYYYRLFGVYPAALERPFIINDMDDGYIESTIDNESYILRED